MPLVEAHGGKLHYLVLDADASAALKKEAKSLPSWTLNDRQICDLEMILDGSFSPLNGFLNEADYNSVLDSMRLQNGGIWPIPITLDVTEDCAEKIKISDELALKDKLKQKKSF